MLNKFKQDLQDFTTRNTDENSGKLDDEVDETCENITAVILIIITMITVVFLFWLQNSEYHLSVHHQNLYQEDNWNIKLQINGCTYCRNQELKSPTLWLYYYYKKFPIIVFKMSDHLALDLDEHVICCVKNALTPSFRCTVAQILLALIMHC